MALTLKEIKDLIRYVANAGVGEVMLEEGDFKLIIKTEKAFQPESKEVMMVQAPAAAPAPAPAAQASAAPSAAPSDAAAAPAPEADEGLVEITAPMVGTFYRRPAPDKPPFVQVGDHVEPGQTVCIIEAMKLFNEIESEISGTIVKVLVDDATPVEFGQPLFLVKPD